jgi:hypothetical protein
VAGQRRIMAAGIYQLEGRNPKKRLQRAECE